MKVKTCNCGNNTYEADGVCAVCKMKKRLEGSSMDEKTEKKKYRYVCKKEGCERRRWKQGYCRRHYKEICGSDSEASGDESQRPRLRNQKGNGQWKDQIKKLICLLEQIPMDVTPEQKADLIIYLYERLYE